MHPSLIACLFVLLSSSAFAQDWPTVVVNASKSVPRLEMQVGEDRGACSGAIFRIDDGWAYALTAAHCVDHKPTEHFDLTVNDRHGYVLDFNNLLDLAIIRFRAHKEVPFVIAPERPLQASPVAVLGYSFGVEELVTQFGWVAQPYNKETKTIWLDAMTVFGQSGGSVIDPQGRLIAITSRIYTGGLFGQSAHLGAAVPAESVMDFIEAFTEQQKQEKKRSGQ